MLTHRIDDDIDLFLLMPYHAEAFFALVEANRAFWGEWLGWVGRITDVESTREMLQRGLNELAAGTGMRFGIRYHALLVGRAFYHFIDYEHAHKLEIGFQIDQSMTGKGIITRVVRAMTDHAFAEMGMNKVEILCSTDNIRSRAVAERLGFQHEGVLRANYHINGQFQDLAVYGIFAAEWKKPNTTGD